MDGWTDKIDGISIYFHNFYVYNGDERLIQTQFSNRCIFAKIMTRTTCAKRWLEVSNATSILKMGCAQR